MLDSIAIDGGGGGVYPEPLAGATWPRHRDHGWRESARQPARFVDRVLLRFTDGRNREWLRAALSNPELRLTPAARRAALVSFDAAFEDFAAVSAGEGIDGIEGGEAIPRTGTNVPTELRRLNQEFLTRRVRAARAAALYSRENEARNRWTEHDNEDYAWRQFEADSLRPAGFESLNGNEPLYELREDTRRVDARGYLTRGPRRENFRGGPREADPPANLWGDDNGDEAWDERGDAHRSVERAREEFERSLGFAPNKADRVVGDAPPTRYNRYEEIPVWQRLKRDGTDRDIEETLGSGLREADSNHYGWGQDEILRRGSARTGSGRRRGYGTTHNFIT